MTKLLIIDDDHELFSLLTNYLGDEGFMCFHAADGDSGLAKLLSGEFNAVILDYMLPGLNGLQVLQAARARFEGAQVPILMLTAHGDEADLVTGLEQGADDYLAKPFDVQELLARLKALLRRTSRYARPTGGTAVELDDLAFDKQAMCVLFGETKIQLTAQELRLMELFVEQPGEVLARATLYQSIFGHPPFPEDRSLDMLVSRLRKKLGKRADGGERIRAARGEGYIYVLAGDQ